MEIDLYSQTGELKGKTSVSDEIFASEASGLLIHQALVIQQGNLRQSIANTKTRAFVRGGGRKPWKQKHTGRAQQGSIRSPQFRGGGIVFGPTSESNFKRRLPAQQRQKALFGVLTEKAKQNQIVVIEELQFKTPHTKIFVELLAKLPSARSWLIVLAGRNPAVVKSGRAIANLNFTTCQSLKIADLLKNEKILFTDKALENLGKPSLTKTI
ncbi:50S ribosomal protein L4 [Candidatus Peregrinibacteria bacterium CG08_land_8_20_14_0_20_41_10]|nr:MAG: 50S ribosomal protein L4 [Candidatus Peregrinibacteria bacterium CG1_02_41_10]PIS32261.1 MAG: 50S ribosomal protein L4 [Candidatus Peregrinibacteria bacterium CG08_land_8_20_14_0_20_41_10]